jgi:hypothetical protein
MEHQSTSAPGTSQYPNLKNLKKLQRLEQILETQRKHYPKLSIINHYKKLSSNLQAKQILKELEALESQVVESLITTEDERQLFSASKTLDYFNKLLNLTLTPEEFRRGDRPVAPTSIKALTGFLNKKIMDLKQYYENALFLEEGFEDVIKYSEDFYHLTLQRDQAFINNMLQVLNRRGDRPVAPTESAVLIAGGYHTPNLKKLLKERNISYVVLTPTITHETNTKRYEQLLLNQKLTAPIASPILSLQPTSHTIALIQDGLNQLIPWFPQADQKAIYQEVFIERNKNLFGGSGIGVGGAGSFGGRPIELVPQENPLTVSSTLRDEEIQQLTPIKINLNQGARLTKDSNQEENTFTRRQILQRGVVGAVLTALGGLGALTGCQNFRSFQKSQQSSLDQEKTFSVSREIEGSQSDDQTQSPRFSEKYYELHTELVLKKDQQLWIHYSTNASNEASVFGLEFFNLKDTSIHEPNFGFAVMEDKKFLIITTSQDTPIKGINIYTKVAGQTIDIHEIQLSYLDARQFTGSWDKRNYGAWHGLIFEVLPTPDKLPAEVFRKIQKSIKETKDSSPYASNRFIAQQIASLRRLIQNTVRLEQEAILSLYQAQVKLEARLKKDLNLTDTDKINWDDSKTKDTFEKLLKTNPDFNLTFASIQRLSQEIKDHNKNLDRLQKEFNEAKAKRDQKLEVIRSKGARLAEGARMVEDRGQIPAPQKSFVKKWFQIGLISLALIVPIGGILVHYSKFNIGLHKRPLLIGGMRLTTLFLTIEKETDTSRTFIVINGDRVGRGREFWWRHDETKVKTSKGYQWVDGEGNRLSESLELGVDSTTGFTIVRERNYSSGWEEEILYDSNGREVSRSKGRFFTSKEQVVEILKDLADPKVTPDFIESGIDRLSRIDDEDLPELIKGLQDPNPVVREAVSKALKNMGKKAESAIEALEKLLETEENLEVRKAAEAARRQIKDGARLTSSFIIVRTLLVLGFAMLASCWPFGYFDSSSERLNELYLKYKEQQNNKNISQDRPNELYLKYEEQQGNQNFNRESSDESYLKYKEGRSGQNSNERSNELYLKYKEKSGGARLAAKDVYADPRFAQNPPFELNHPSRRDFLKSLGVAAGLVVLNQIPGLGGSVYAESKPWPKFKNLDDVVKFIVAQKAGGKGLPATWHVPGGVDMNDPDANRIVREGVGLYDTSLAILALVEAGKQKEAKEILEIYASGMYGNMDLKVQPNRHNGGAFEPFGSTIYYLFNFTRFSGKWGPEWRYWNAHTGPNAWLVLAIAQYTQKFKDDTFRALAIKIANGMRLLQDEEALGGVRYGPKGQWHPSGDNDKAFNEINTENQVSAYAALMALYSVTGDMKYSFKHKESADKILYWLSQARVYNPITNQYQNGLYNKETGVLSMGADFDGEKWVLQGAFATDSAGTWTISALGPELIDQIWGKGAAFKMWAAIHKRTGLTSDLKRASSLNQVLAGVDFTDQIDGQAINEKSALISNEWSDGMIEASKEIVAYYTKNPVSSVTAQDLAEIQKDIDSMIAYAQKDPNSYAKGPGNKGWRYGRTGFGWIGSPEGVTAMASVMLFIQDPLSFWRKNGVKEQPKVEVKKQEEKVEQKQEPKKSDEKFIVLAKDSQIETAGGDEWFVAYADLSQNQKEKLSKAKSVKFIFSGKQAGINFLARFLQDGSSPGRPEGLVSWKPFQVPQPKEGEEEVAVTVLISNLPKTVQDLIKNKNIVKVSLHSGQYGWPDDNPNKGYLNKDNGQEAVPLRIEISEGARLAEKDSSSSKKTLLQVAVIAGSVVGAMTAVMEAKTWQIVFFSAIFVGYLVYQRFFVKLPAKNREKKDSAKDIELVDGNFEELSFPKIDFPKIDFLDDQENEFRQNRHSAYPFQPIRSPKSTLWWTMSDLFSQTLDFIRDWWKSTVLLGLGYVLLFHSGFNFQNSFSFNWSFSAGTDSKSKESQLDAKRLENRKKLQKDAEADVVNRHSIPFWAIVGSHYEFDGNHEVIVVEVNGGKFYKYKFDEETSNIWPSGGARLAEAGNNSSKKEDPIVSEKLLNDLKSQNPKEQQQTVLSLLIAKQNPETSKTLNELSSTFPAQTSERNVAEILRFGTRVAYAFGESSVAGKSTVVDDTYLSFVRRPQGLTLKINGTGEELPLARRDIKTFEETEASSLIQDPSVLTVPEMLATTKAFNTRFAEGLEALKATAPSRAPHAEIYLETLAKDLENNLELLALDVEKKGARLSVSLASKDPEVLQRANSYLQRRGLAHLFKAPADNSYITSFTPYAQDLKKTQNKLPLLVKVSTDSRQVINYRPLFDITEAVAALEGQIAEHELLLSKLKSLRAGDSTISFEGLMRKYVAQGFLAPEEAQGIMLSTAIQKVTSKLNYLRMQRKIQENA